MIFGKTMRMMFLSGLLVPLAMQAATVVNAPMAADKQKLVADGMNPDNRKFDVAEPWSMPLVALLSIGGGAALGYVLGASAEPHPCAGVGAAIGGVLVGGCALWSNHSYRTVFNASDGKDLRGAAASNNARGVRAWLDYDGGSIKRDEDGRIPLHFAASNGADDAASALLSKMPHKMIINTDQIRETTTESTTHKADIDIWHPFDHLNYKPETTESKTTDRIKREIDPVNLQDEAAGRTAAVYAGLRHQYATLALLLRNRADGNIKDKLGNDIPSLAAKDQAVKDAVESAS